VANERLRAPKRWGHPLHAMCPALDAFPASLGHFFLQKYTHRNDAVLDPFCGSGVAPLQACAEGRIGIGMDTNPIACALTVAKIIPPDLPGLHNRIDDLSNDMFFAPIEHEPPAAKMLFHPKVLSQLVFLRQSLHAESRVDAFLIGTILGILHGDQRERPGSFLSAPIPASLCDTPHRIMRYLAESGSKAGETDVFHCLRRKIASLLRYKFPVVEGRFWNSSIQNQADLPDPALRGRRVQLVIGMPPLVHNPPCDMAGWVRRWFLNVPSADTAGSFARVCKLEDCLKYLQDISRILYRIMRPGAVCALILPDLPRRGSKEPVELAQEAWRHLKRKRTRFELVDIVAVESASGATPSGPASEPIRKLPATRILILSKGACVELVDHVAW